MEFKTFLRVLTLGVLMAYSVAIPVKSFEGEESSIKSSTVPKPTPSTKIQAENMDVLSEGRNVASLPFSSVVYEPSLPPDFPVGFDGPNRLLSAQPQTWLEFFTFGYVGRTITKPPLKEAQEEELHQGHATTIFDSQAMQNILNSYPQEEK